MAAFDPKDNLAWRSPETVAKRHRQDCLELLGKSGEFCHGGLLCSEPPSHNGSIRPLCWSHFLEELCKPNHTNWGRAPRLAPVPANETCHLQDLVLPNNNIIANDGDATSEYNEAGAPPTEGGDVEGQYESSEVDNGAVAFDSLESDDPVLRSAASVPLPGAEKDDDLEELDEPEDTGSTFHLPGVNWSWPSEASVALLVRRKAETRVLLRIFPPAQWATELAGDRLKCNARAKISRATGRWEACNCSTTFERQYDYRRHFLTIHLGGSRWEDVARQRKTHGKDSTSTAALLPKKPRAKREPRQAQPLASTSASASTSTAGPPPEVQPRKPRQKRRRQVIEDESSDDGGFEDRDQGDSDRKGKKARRW